MQIIVNTWTNDYLAMKAIKSYRGPSSKREESLKEEKELQSTLT